MARRVIQPSYYDILQVSPRASEAEIRAAYTRLREQYNPEHTAAAAPDLQALAADKRQQLEEAYATLASAESRAAYDHQRGIGSSELDAPFNYRPLPPARGQERANARPDIDANERDPSTERRRPQQRGAVSWIVPAGVASLLLAVLLAAVINPIRVSSGSTALATPTLSDLVLPFSAVQIDQFRRAAQGGNTAELWAALGNAQFDNLQTLRENARISPQYQGVIGSWLDVVSAYDRSLALSENAAVRSSRAVALMNYGLDAQDPARVAEAVSEVERGIAADTRDPRALLNFGFVLSMTDPPRTDQAVAQWQKLVDTAPDAPEAEIARTLLERYDQANG